MLQLYREPLVEKDVTAKGAFVCQRLYLRRAAGAGVPVGKHSGRASHILLLLLPQAPPLQVWKPVQVPPPVSQGGLSISQKPLTFVNSLPSLASLSTSVNGETTKCGLMLRRHLHYLHTQKPTRNVQPFDIAIYLIYLILLSWYFQVQEIMADFFFASKIHHIYHQHQHWHN